MYTHTNTPATTAAKFNAPARLSYHGKDQKPGTEGEGGGGGEAKKGKKSHKSCRRDMENRGGMGGKRRERRQESTGSLYIDPAEIENRKEAGRKV